MLRIERWNFSVEHLALRVRSTTRNQLHFKAGLWRRIFLATSDLVVDSTAPFFYFQNDLGYAVVLFE